MDFGALPPEVNSALMYTGPGAAPMTAAAAAWNRLAAELSSTAAHYESVLAGLTGEQWTGSASASMTAAAQPYLAWMTLTAGQLHHAAAQAAASAAAFEAAFAMTVPPPAIAANRTQLAALVATNFLGLNTPVIMAAEALYAEMWAQDAAAMYGYAAASASAAALTTPSPPPPVASPGGVGLQAAAVGRAAAAGAADTGLVQSISAIPNTVGALANPLASVTAADIVTSIDGLLGTPFVSIAVNGVVSAAGWWSMNAVPNSVLAGHTLGVNSAAAAAAVPAVASAPAASPASGPAGLRGTPVLAAAGKAASVGALSVPPMWSAAAPVAPAATAAGSGWVAGAAEGSTSVVPAGIPAVASAGRGGPGVPRYGVKPTVMPKTGLL